MTTKKSKRNPKKSKKVEMCKCGKNPATDPHPCPYAEDINNDSETLCDCCDDCQQECANDI